MTALRSEIRRLDTTPPALRRFGFVVGGVFAAIAGWLWWRSGGTGSAVTAGLAALAGLLLTGGVIAPRALRGPYLGWMTLALVLGFVTSRVLLTVVFVGAVVPTGLVLRLLGRSPLALRPDPSATTYWHVRDASPPDPASYERYY